MHFACCLPVRQGTDAVDDGKLRDDGTTRIYTQFIDNTTTLKMQDMINQHFTRKFLDRIPTPFSTATLLNYLGNEMLEDDFIVRDKKGSFVISAAKYGVPIFLDSGSNHSLGMDFSALQVEGRNADTSPTQDILEAAALSLHTQPQLNIFLGEGGPRNFIQTTGPTAAEIFYVPFEGSDSCIRFTTADQRTGGLSGSKHNQRLFHGENTGKPEGT